MNTFQGRLYIIQFRLNSRRTYVNSLFVRHHSSVLRYLQETIRFSIADENNIDREDYLNVTYSSDAFNETDVTDFMLKVLIVLIGIFVFVSVVAAFPAQNSFWDRGTKFSTSKAEIINPDKITTRFK